MVADTVMARRASTAGEAAGAPRPGDWPERDESGVDAALLVRVAAGDPAALAEFYDRFARRVHSLARRICGPGIASEDVAQDVFLDVWRRATRFDPARGSAATWLMTLTHHRAVDAVRREAALRRYTQPARDDDWDDLPPAPGAEHAAVGSIVARHVRDAITELPPGQRQVVALAYYGGHTQSEIAAILAIPQGTVKSRTFTAMALLREDPRQHLHDLL